MHSLIEAFNMETEPLSFMYTKNRYLISLLQFTGAYTNASVNIRDLYLCDIYPALQNA